MSIKTILIEIDKKQILIIDDNGQSYGLPFEILIAILEERNFPQIN